MTSGQGSRRRHILLHFRHIKTQLVATFFRFFCRFEVKSDLRILFSVSFSGLYIEVKKGLDAFL